MNHIAEWRSINKRHEEQREAERGRKAAAKKTRIAKIKSWLTKHGAENITTNGYVWDFDYKGMSGHFCDQTDRVVGAIHRPFLSEEDRECYNDMETHMMMVEADYFITEYAYQQFCIEGEPWYSLCEVFLLIENFIKLRKTGVSS